MSELLSEAQFNPLTKSLVRGIIFPSRDWIEMGQTDHSSSLIRALDGSGMIWESREDYETIDEAMKALETALADWMKQHKE